MDTYKGIQVDTEWEAVAARAPVGGTIRAAAADEASVKRILVCQHVAFEILGTLNPLFKSYGFRIRYVNFGREPEARPCLDRYQGLVLLPCS